MTDIIPLDQYPKLNRTFSSCVLDIPKIEPDDWELWWSWWETNAKPLTKVYSSINGDPGLNHWHGVQIYGDDAPFDPWNITKVDCTKEFPKMFENIFKIPMDIQRIRAVTSKGMFTPHKDHPFPVLSCRINLYDNNPGPTFGYVNANDRPRKFYLQRLPDTSNTWVYQDHTQDHTTFYNNKHFKILFMLLGRWRSDELNELIDRSVQKYPEYYVE
jgi:hypothetical protein